MADFYTTFVKGLPRDEWGHPALPMPERISRRDYASRLLTLQIELVRMQQWVRAARERVLIFFEGRDTAGKGGTIQRPAQTVEAERTRRAGTRGLWENYTLAALELFLRTDQPETPWWFVNNNNKRVGRLNLIQHVLALLPYEGKDESAIGQARQDIVAPVRALLPTITPDRP